MIKKLIILTILFFSACQSQMVEEKLSSNDVEYSIQHPKDWDFRNYGFDGDTYDDPHLEANATLTYGKLLDAKISIYLIEKSDNNCALKGITSHTYQEVNGDLTKESRMKSLNKFFDEWREDEKEEFARVYFAASDKECVLFELYKKKNSNHVFRTFYDLIDSFHKIEK